MKFRFFMALMVAASLAIMSGMVKAADVRSQLQIKESSKFWQFNGNHPYVIPGLVALATVVGAPYVAEKYGTTLSNTSLAAGGLATFLGSEQLLREALPADWRKALLLNCSQLASLRSSRIKDKNPGNLATAEWPTGEQVYHLPTAKRTIIFTMTPKIREGSRTDRVVTGNKGTRVPVQNVNAPLVDYTVRITNNTLLSMMLAPLLAEQVV